MGEISVSPPLREIRIGDRRQTVEPRVMQALVVLVHAEGAVVSRDLLIEKCWGGRIVGDDAINRCIAKVRAIANLSDGHAFEIATIPRVGYRLKCGNSAPDDRAYNVESRAKIAEAVTLPRRPFRGRWVATGAALLLTVFAIGSIAIYMARAPLQARWNVVQSDVPIATAMLERYPAISPDGMTIAYSAGTNILTRKIYLHPVSGGESLRLTDDNFDDVSPAWSPDGRQIAYVGYRENEPCHLMIVAVPAGTPREIGRCLMDQRTTLRWVPKASAVYFLDSPDSKAGDQIVRLDIGTGRRALVDHPPATSLGDDQFSPSPDGRWLTYERVLRDASSQRIVLDLRNGSESVLTNYPYSLGAAWAEDSQTIFVALEKGHDFALWAYSRAGGSPTRVFSGPQQLARPAAGPNGLLAVEINSALVGLARAPPSQNAQPQFLVPDKGFDHSPDVSSNSSIAFTAERSGGGGLYVLPRNGQLHKLLDLPLDIARAAEPRWSPDGSRIAFTSDGSSFLGIRVLTADGADVATVRFPGKEIYSVAWDGDGKSLIFPGSMDGRDWRLWRIDLVHPQKFLALPYSGWIYVRTHGSALYGMRADAPGVWRIDGIPKRITLLPTSDRANEWTIVDDSIAYVVDPFAERRQLMVQPILGGPARTWMSVPGYCSSQSFAIDPADGSIIYDAGHGSDSDIALLHLAER